MNPTITHPFSGMNEKKFSFVHYFIKGLIISLIIYLNLFTKALAQEIPVAQNGQTKTTYRQFGQCNREWHYHQKNNEQIDSANDNIRNIIVKFREDPLIVVYRKNLSLSTSSPGLDRQVEKYKEQFKTFRSDIDKIFKAGAKLSSISSGNNQFEPTFRNKYTRVFFGQHITVESWMIDEIKKLPYVKAVFIDRPVKVSLEESILQIQADRVWNELGSQGDSVRVGIIDSGIDYNHPDLGGGFGNGYKVIGGYDFVNQDNDPMDDYWHGTHVAGIVAADGQIKGVAPKAFLYALKALDESGSGYTSDVISAIEYTVDPDNNSDFSDKLDVVNMSLGGYPVENDPLVEAVETATAIGVTFCIAAGNNGEYGVMTINSPGTAPSAITVGAVDKSNLLAYFSSIGPVPYSFILKPDIVAPGVGINSCIPNNEYARASGTSMAAPHIAGVCALLKKLHPDWGPAYLKAAIMTSSKDMGLDRIYQGSGLVNAYKAAITNTLIDKPTIDFGMDSLPDIWSSSMSLIIKNVFTEERTYSIASSISEPGITFGFNQTDFTIGAGNEITIDISITVNNSLLKPLPVFGSKMYSGGLNLVTGTDTCRINWDFIRAVRITIDPESLIFNFILFNNNDVALINGGYYTTDELLILPGKYQLIAEFGDEILESYINEYGMLSFMTIPNKIVVKEVEINSCGKVPVTKDEANNKIIFATVDENGDDYTANLEKIRNICIELNDTVLYEIDRRTQNYLAGGGTYGTERYSPAGRILFIGTYADYVFQEEEDFRKADTIYISDIPDTIRVILGETRQHNDDGYKFCNNSAGPYAGISGDMIFSNNPANYREIYYKENGNRTANYWRNRVIWKNTVINRYRWYEGGMDFALDGFQLFMPSKEDIMNDFGIFLEYHKDILISTTPFNCIDNRFLNAASVTPEAYLFSPGDTITRGKGAYFVKTVTNNNQLKNSSVNIRTYHRNALNDEATDGYSCAWKLFDMEDHVIDSSGWLEKEMILNPAPGKYRAQFISKVFYLQYYIPMLSFNDFGKITTNLWFDLNNNDCIPPSLNAFQVRDFLEKPYDRINKGDSAKIVFALTDAKYTPLMDLEYHSIISDSTQLFIKPYAPTGYWDPEPYNSTGWVPIKVSSIGESQESGIVYQGIFTDTDYDTAAFSVKIITVDSVGNRMQQVISPAVFVKNMQPPIANDDLYSLSINQSYHSDYPVINNDVNPFDTVSQLEVILKNDVKHGKLTFYNNDLNIFSSVTGIIDEQKGSFKYIPDRDFYGTDSFTYKVRNEKYSSNVATVLLNVVAPNGIEEYLEFDTKGNKTRVFPNPVSEELYISITLEQPEQISISTFNLMGQKVDEIFVGNLEAGENLISWDVKDSSNAGLQSSLYLIQIQGVTFNKQHKIMIK